MVVLDVGGRKFYVDDKLKRGLEKIRARVLGKDEDYFFVIDGSEGAGKSVLALQLACVLDPSFELKRVVFTAKDFQGAILKADRGQAIVFDEAFRGLSSRSTLNEVNKMLVQLMMECRQKNLFVIIVLPSIFMLDSYVALHRAKGLFHVYRRKEQRGFWMYFNQKKKKLLYLKGKKLYSYSFPKTTFRGRFFNQYAIDEESYREKKGLAFRSGVKPLRAEELLDQRNILLWYINRKLGMSTYELSEELEKLGWKIKHNSISEMVVKKDKDFGGK